MKIKNLFSIKIYDEERNRLSFDLKDIICLLNPINYSKLKWSVLTNLELNNGQNDLPKELWGFYGKIESAEEITKIDIDWDLINFISNNVLQVIDGTFIGRDENYHIEITTHDSSLWIVKTNDKAVLPAIKGRFKDIRIKKKSYITSSK